MVTLSLVPAVTLTYHDRRSLAVKVTGQLSRLGRHLRPVANKQDLTGNLGQRSGNRHENKAGMWHFRTLKYASIERLHKFSKQVGQLKDRIISVNKLDN